MLAITPRSNQFISTSSRQSSQHTSLSPSHSSPCNNKMSPSTDTPTPRIAIIGAGPAGLTLARTLHINNIPVTVFERETSSTARSQGGTLDLHPRAGQAAIKKAGLWDEYQQHVRYEGQDLVLADYKTGEMLVDVRDEDTGRYVI